MKPTNFKDWTLDKLDEIFELEQIPEEDCQLLHQWEDLAKQQTISDYEEKSLTNLQRPLKWAGKSWNEVEVESKFISPIMLQVGFDDMKMGFFLERKLAGVIGDYELSGTVDGMVATGFRNPKIPFFCMQEYAPTSPEGTDSISPFWGDARGAFPDAQALVAMMVAREMNDNKKPIYGMYVVGLIWNFMVLEGNEYCISNDYKSDDDEVFDIFKMLKALKQIIKTELM